MSTFPDSPSHADAAGGKEPTRAIALRYASGTDEAPRITATGQGGVAEQILQLAFAHGVKVRQDAPLVEILGMLEVDSLIPLEAYAAVAEILSYVYKANAAESRLRERRQDAQATTDTITTSRADTAHGDTFLDPDGHDVAPPHDPTRNP